MKVSKSDLRKARMIRLAANVADRISARYPQHPDDLEAYESEATESAVNSLDAAVEELQSVVYEDSHEQSLTPANIEAAIRMVEGAEIDFNEIGNSKAANECQEVIRRLEAMKRQSQRANNEIREARGRFLAVLKDVGKGVSDVEGKIQAIKRRV